MVQIKHEDAESAFFSCVEHARVMCASSGSMDHLVTTRELWDKWQYSLKLLLSNRNTLRWVMRLNRKHQNKLRELPAPTRLNHHSLPPFYDTFHVFRFPRSRLRFMWQTGQPATQPDGRSAIFSLGYTVTYQSTRKCPGIAGCTSSLEEGFLGDLRRKWNNSQL